MFLVTSKIPLIHQVHQKPSNTGQHLEEESGVFLQWVRPVTFWHFLPQTQKQDIFLNRCRMVTFQSLFLSPRPQRSWTGPGSVQSLSVCVSVCAQLNSSNIFEGKGATQLKNFDATMFHITSWSFSHKLGAPYGHLSLAKLSYPQGTHLGP